MKKSKIVTKCQICNSKKLESILFLGYLPPVNKLQKLAPNQTEESYPAELLFCNNCKLVQLGLIVDQKYYFHMNILTPAAQQRYLEKILKIYLLN